MFVNLCTLCISMLELPPLTCRKHKRQRSVEADTCGIGPNREQDSRAASGVSRSSSFSSTKQLVAGTCTVSWACSATHLHLQQLLVQLRLNPPAARLHVLSLSSVTTCVLQQHIAITIVELKKEQPAAGACGHYVTDYAWSSTWPFALAAGRLRSEKRTGSFTALMSALTSVVSGGVDAVADATVSNLPVHSLDTGVDVEHLDICHLGHHK